MSDLSKHTNTVAGGQPDHSPRTLATPNLSSKSDTFESPPRSGTRPAPPKRTGSTLVPRRDTVEATKKGYTQYLSPEFLSALESPVPDQALRLAPGQQVQEHMLGDALPATRDVDPSADGGPAAQNDDVPARTLIVEEYQNESSVSEKDGQEGSASG